MYINNSYHFKRRCSTKKLSDTLLFTTCLTFLYCGTKVRKKSHMLPETIVREVLGPSFGFQYLERCGMQKIHYRFGFYKCH
jgi:hypothetical protein